MPGHRLACDKVGRVGKTPTLRNPRSPLKGRSTLNLRWSALRHSVIVPERKSGFERGSAVEVGVSRYKHKKSSTTVERAMITRRQRMESHSRICGFHQLPWALRGAARKRPPPDFTGAGDGVDLSPKCSPTSSLSDDWGVCISVVRGPRKRAG